MTKHDVDVIDRATLDPEHQANFALPWIVQYPNGYSITFETEEGACRMQRAHRNAIGLDEMTGEACITDTITIEFSQPKDESQYAEVGAQLIDAAHKLGMAISVFTPDELSGVDEGHVEDAMIAKGWDIINTLLRDNIDGEDE